MTYCKCSHADILHVDHFIHGRQECDVKDCNCTQYKPADHPRRVNTPR